MSETRHVWKPWRANTRTAASRISRRLSTAGAFTRAPRRLTRQSPRPARIPGMRTHKSWTWVGAFGPELMLCAASARIGPARMSWWAVWDGERLHERTYRRARPVAATPERVRVDGVLDLTVEPGAPWAVRTGEIWTRKRPARVHGVALGSPVHLPGLVDESAGRHHSMSWGAPARASWPTAGRSRGTSSTGSTTAPRSPS